MPQICVAAVGIYWYWNVHVESIHFNGYEYGRKIKEEAKDLYYKKYVDERNKKLYKQMERYTTSSDQKNQYCQKTILSKVIHRFSIIPIKLPMTFFFFFTDLGQKKKKLKIFMEIQKTLSSQSNLEKEKWSLRNQAPWFQTIL